MGPPLSKKDLETLIAQALDRYREHHETGDDMADAGAELARRIEDLLAGPVCGLPREEVLRARAEIEKHHAAAPTLPPPEDDYGYSDYR